MARIAVVGSYGTGLSLRVPQAPGSGETIIGGPFEVHAGGKGSNQAIGAARLGAEVCLLTALGCDPFAQQARDLWADEGIDASHVIEVDAATMVGVILVEDSGENRIAIAPGALDHITPDLVDRFAPEIRRADVCLVQLEIPPAAVKRALQIARDSGVTTVFNPAPARSLDPRILRLADFLTPNETEAAALVGREGPAEDLARELLGIGAGTVVLTLGARGALLADRTGIRRVPAFPARASDTTGAGDALNAALAVALAERLPVEEAVRWGCAAGAREVEGFGVVPPLPTRQCLLDTLSTGKVHA